MIATQLAVLLVAAAAAVPGWMGFDYTWSPPAKNGARMLRVERVVPGGPAARAGLQPGDLVTTMNSRRVDFSDELEFLLFLNDQRPGQHLKLGVVREGKPLAIDVTLGTMSPQAVAKRKENIEYARSKRASDAAARAH